MDFWRDIAAWSAAALGGVSALLYGSVRQALLTKADKPVVDLHHTLIDNNVTEIGKLYSKLEDAQVDRRAEYLKLLSTITDNHLTVMLELGRKLDK